jgi:lipoprotein-anchoring transpeptidase ErfK/SrfK
MEVTQMFSKTFKALMVCGALALGAAAVPMEARADWLSDLFGDSSGNFVGRTRVGFSPRFEPGQIVVSFGDRRLYFVDQRGSALSYPIAIPKGEARWAGVMSISDKRINPSWTPTAEMRRDNPKLPAFVPGGHPRNPLGVRALYLGSSLYRIHGTDAPWLIGQEVSKGCIRMLNDDVVDLYNRARIGTRVTVTWSRFNAS